MFQNGQRDFSKRRGHTLAKNRETPYAYNRKQSRPLQLLTSIMVAFLLEVNPPRR